MRRLALDDDRTGSRMIRWGNLARALELVGEELDRVEVLCMNHDERTVLAGDGEHVEDLAVIQAKARVGHEDLERGIAVGDQCRKVLPETLCCRIGQNEMEGVVDVAATGGLLMIGMDGIAQPLTALLEREGDHGRVATEGGRECTGDEVVGLYSLRAARLGDMHVTVDPARGTR